MAEKLDINCRTPDGQAYSVVLTVTGVEFLIDATASPEIAKCDGEELVEKLLFMNHGEIRRLDRRTPEGQCSDSPDGRPAHIIFNERGKTLQEVHGHNGRLHDGANGEPAVCGFDEEGKIVCAARYSEGEKIKELSPQELAAYLAFLGGLNPPKNPPPALRGPSFP